jgi:hypothetical protein
MPAVSHCTVSLAPTLQISIFFPLFLFADFAQFPEQTVALPSAPLAG